MIVKVEIHYEVLPLDKTKTAIPNNAKSRIEKFVLSESPKEFQLKETDKVKEPACSVKRLTQKELLERIKQRLS